MYHDYYDSAACHLCKQILESFPVHQHGFPQTLLRANSSLRQNHAIEHAFGTWGELYHVQISHALDDKGHVWCGDRRDHWPCNCQTTSFALPKNLDLVLGSTQAHDTWMPRLIPRLISTCRTSGRDWKHFSSSAALLRHASHG